MARLISKPHMGLKPNVFILQRGMKTDEALAASAYFKCLDLRSYVPPQSLVIGRYSVLPFYKELEQDLANNKSKLINSYRQHRFVADIGNWYRHLEEITPRTWNRPEDLPDNGPFIVKGETNSKKFQWRTHMFAANKHEAIDVMCRLQEDSLIGEQRIYFREYVPLVKLLDGLQGMPVTEEYRFFVYNKQILCGGYYWSNYSDDLPGGVPNYLSVPEAFLQKAVDIIGDNVPFYVIDIAKTQSGNWIVIELNDGQMAGLSDIPPENLYFKLNLILQSEGI